MSPPPGPVKIALDLITERVLCISDCFSTVSVSYSAARDAVEIRHPDPACECVLHPDGIEATALSQFVIEELSRFCSMAHYGEPAPIHIGCGA